MATTTSFIVEAARLADESIGGAESSGKGQIDTINEALYLYILAATGFMLNLTVVACIIMYKPLRRMTNAFIIHECVLDMVKCMYCVPFATSLLRDIAPSFCTVLGGSYVVIVTASGFNIVAMVCCEAYTFSESNVGGEGRGSFCCIAFGILMVYLGSVIIHLGPTIIGGDFNYNDLIGNCIFVYGTIKSYVVHAMWIVIMTLAMVGAVYYLMFFYRHVQAHSTHRLATLVRASIAISQGNVINSADIRRVVRDSLSRTRVLLIITVLFVLCWYPLFVLTLVDPMFKQPKKIYKLLTFIAWSNAAINPVVFLLFDHNINMIRFLPCVRRWQRCHHNDSMTNTPLMVPRSTRRTTFYTRSLDRRGGGEGEPPVVGGTNPREHYKRVGCRLCHEGQAHSSTHCNGGVGKGSLNRDTSMCEVHSCTV